MSILRRAAASEVVEVVVADERPQDGRSAEESVNLDRWRRLAGSVLEGEGVRGPAVLSVCFVDESVMAELNATHMGEAGPTDVLSFPLDAEPDTAAGATAPRLLGDVVICPAVARRNAVSSGGYEAEVALLVVHGVLHVLGMDHAQPDEAEAMVARERHHLAVAGLERRP